MRRQGVNVGRFLTSFATAVIASKYGWRAVPWVYAAVTAAFAVPFHLLATDTPKDWADRGWPAMSDSEKVLLKVTKAAPEPPVPAVPAGPVAPGGGGGLSALLTSVAALCPVLLHTADNMASYCLAYWA